jgi:hypothetical protein
VCLPDESIHSFFTRRFSPVVADTLTDALSIGTPTRAPALVSCRAVRAVRAVLSDVAVRPGIFGGRSQSLSIKSCFPFLHEYEQKYGSIGLGMLREMLASRSGRPKNETSKSTKNEAAATAEEEETDEGYISPAVQEMQKMKVYSFREGVETLSRALEQKIREDQHTDVLLNTAVERMDQVPTLFIFHLNNIIIFDYILYLFMIIVIFLLLELIVCWAARSGMGRCRSACGTA